MPKSGPGDVKDRAISRRMGLVGRKPQIASSKEDLGMRKHISAFWTIDRFCLVSHRASQGDASRGNVSAAHVC